MNIEATHLSFSYTPGKTILHDISLKASSGDILYILGRNGSGKTTLLSCLAGLLNPETGKVLLNSISLTEYKNAEKARIVGVIPQIHIPVFAFSVHELVLMGRAPYLNWMSSPSKKDRDIVDQALDRVGLYELRDRAYKELSGGEQQLVLIARGLAQKCNILLMDEPTSHLDLSNRHQILEIVKQLSRQGLTFIIASHAPNDALSYADQVLLLNKGWVTGAGSPQSTITEDALSLIYGIDTEVIFEENNGSKKAKAVITRRPAELTPESLIEDGNIFHDMVSKDQGSPQLLLVTGLRGAGKTTWCTKLTEVAKSSGMKVKGILSPGIYKGNNKIGIGVQAIASGEIQRLAELRTGEIKGLATPRWRFLPTSMTWANDIIREADNCDLLIIDEMGPLELLQGKGLTSGIERLDKMKYKVACVVIRPSLIPTALQRWPHAKVVSGVLPKSQ